MKTEISRDSHQPQQRYSGVYQQQGRMLTDADWNELVEILKQRLNESLKDVVGVKSGSSGGTPRHRALRIVEDATLDFRIQPGHIYANGVPAWLPGDASLAYDTEQPDFPSPPATSGNYVLYADVWEHTVTQLMDTRLRDKGLHGADTCSRKQTLAQIKWCPYNAASPDLAENDPETFIGNPSRGDAKLLLNLLQKTTDADPCDPCAAALEVASKVGNYLFRVEVHDVQGDADSPTQITLKWSSENGAEQFEALPSKEEMPAGFISDNRVYEFFDETSERHLGVHLTNTGWQAARGVLTEIDEPANPYVVPSITGSTETRSYVRRWDGYCVIDLSGGGNTLDSGVDRGVKLSTSKAVDSLGYVAVGSSLEIVLDAIKLELTLDDHSFVAGDFWLSDVREAEHDPLDPLKSILIEDSAPLGIEHHYLILGRVVGGGLQVNAEADRKYAFPSLSEMTRLVMAGGDGQEILPGLALPQALRVGVANGEWPVEGATVRFQIECGGGSLTPLNNGLSNAEGIAECEWTPDAVIGAECRVRATLVDPDHAGDASADLTPPVYFYANLISADQVAYEPGCPPSTVNTVHNHLEADAAVTLDIGADGYYSVKEVLDALLCGVQAKHIPYDPLPKDPRWADINDSPDRPDTVQQAIDDLAENLESTDIRYEVPECGDAATPTVRFNLGLTPGTTKIDQVLDKLLCELRATDVPIDRDDVLCDRLRNDATVQTIQDAINVLCEVKPGGGCAITVGEGGQFQTLDDAFEAHSDAEHICICLLAGDHSIIRTTALKEKVSIKMSGCGALASRVYLVGNLLLEATEIVLRDLSITGGEIDSTTTQAGGLTLLGLKSSQVFVENCRFNRVFRGTASNWTPAVSVEGVVQLEWRGNLMNASRQNSVISGAVLPRPEGLGAETLEVYTELKAVWAMNPYDTRAGFEEKVASVAKKIVGLSMTNRNSLFEARFSSRIDRLPARNVDIGFSSRLLETGPVRAREMRVTADSDENTALAIAVSPKNEVKGLFNDIKSISAAEIQALIDRIKIVAMLVTSVDDALSLGQAQVGGNIHDNVISGQLVLLAAQADAAAIDWGMTDSEQRARKNAWGKKGGFLTGSGNLSIHDNTITAVRSMVPKQALKAMQELISGNAGLNPSFEGYESLSVQGNRFINVDNSFVAIRIRLHGNEFSIQGDDDMVVAYVMGYSNVMTGNLANHGWAALEQASRQLGSAANLLDII